MSDILHSIVQLFLSIQLFFSPVEYNSDEVSRLLTTYSNDRKYSEVCWLTAHNAFANLDDGWSYHQQPYGFEWQYDAGTRSFMVDLYWYQPNTTAQPLIAMCHEPNPNNNLSCPYSSITKKGPPRSFKSLLEQIKQWLDTDPNTIITLHCESYLRDVSWKNNEGKIVNLIGQQELKKLFQETGLTQYIYFTPFQNNGIIDQWMTLGEMRKNNQRLVVFTDRLTDGLIYTESYRETKYNLSEFPNCEMRNDKRDTHKKMPLLVLNHFHYESLNVPTPKSISLWPFHDINSYDEIIKRVNKCYEPQEQGMLPNFIAVDFVGTGNNGGPIRVVTELNQRPPSDFHKNISTPSSEYSHHHDEL